MYLYIENNNFIPLKEIILIIEYKDFLLKKLNRKIYEKFGKKVIDLSEKEKRTLIITNDFIYITSYTNRALRMRSEEYGNLLNLK